MALRTPPNVRNNYKPRKRHVDHRELSVSGFRRFGLSCSSAPALAISIVASFRFQAFVVSGFRD
jgi:hypothetical protein